MVSIETTVRVHVSTQAVYAGCALLAVLAIAFIVVLFG